MGLSCFRAAPLTRYYATKEQRYRATKTSLALARRGLHSPFERSAPQAGGIGFTGWIFEVEQVGDGVSWHSAPA